MRLCLIADSSSIHVQRIVAYHIKNKDDILILSSARMRSFIPGTETIHLLHNHNYSPNTLDEEGRPKPIVTGLFKHHTRLVFRSFIRQTIRHLRVLHARAFCLKAIERFDPDAIYCFRSFPEGVLASNCHIRPLLLRTAGPDISKFPRYPLYRQAIRKALLAADIVVTESFWERKLLQDLCGPVIDPKVIILGVDTRIFQPDLPRANLREKYRLPHDAFVVISNRYLDGHYNGWSVVKSMQSILHQCPDLFLLYASPSKMSSSTKEKTIDINKHYPQLLFLDGPSPHSEIPNLLGCGDVYISFSSFDGIPNSVLEAMACGLVPIVAELPQLHEWIEHGKTGYIVPQHDMETLASTVLFLYKNRYLIPDISLQCVETIQQRALYESCMFRTRELFRCLIQSSKKGKI